MREASGHRGWAAGILLVSLCVVGAGAQGHSTTASPQRVDSLVDALVRQALQTAISQGAFPDFNLVAATSPIALLSDVRPDGYRLSEEALPKLPDRQFQLLSREQIQAAADSLHTNRYFIWVNRIEVADDRATLWMGVDFVVPTGVHVVRMCCCAAQGEFRLVDRRWALVRRLGVTCI